MKVDYILIASGHTTKPRLNAAILNVKEDDIEGAKNDALTLAVQLEKAGYFSFDLYDVRIDGNHKFISQIKVEERPSVAFFRG